MLCGAAIEGGDYSAHVRERRFHGRGYMAQPEPCTCTCKTIIYGIVSYHVLSLFRVSLQYLFLESDEYEVLSSREGVVEMHPAS